MSTESHELEKADSEISVDSGSLQAGASEVGTTAEQAEQKLERTLSEVEKNTASARELSEKLEIDGAEASKAVKTAATEASAEASEAIAKKLAETKQFKDSKIEGVKDAVDTASRTLQEQLANLKSSADQGRASAEQTINQKARAGSGSLPRAERPCAESLCGALVRSALAEPLCRLFCRSIERLQSALRNQANAIRKDSNRTYYRKTYHLIVAAPALFAPPSFFPPKLCPLGFQQ